MVTFVCKFPQYKNEYKRNYAKKFNVEYLYCDFYKYKITLRNFVTKQNIPFYFSMFVDILLIKNIFDCCINFEDF